MLLLLAALGAACDAADEVPVQPLPELRRPSPEARARLPEVAGAWAFAGWELAPNDSAGLAAGLPALGQIRLETQRLDSLAGAYLDPGVRLPLRGEVRRDSTVALAALLGAGEARLLAGRVRRDTLWISLITLVPAEVWRTGARAAFVRTRLAAAPFTRLKGARPIPVAPADSLGLPAAPPAGAVVALDATSSAVPPGPWPRAAAPAPGAVSVVTPGASAVPPGPWPRAPGARPAPTAAPRPAQSRPAEAAPAEPAREPEPPSREPAPPPAPPIPLLGEPVRPDTAATDTSYSPIAARAVARPRSVSVSR